MADEPRQWDFGSPLDEEGGGLDQSGGPDESDQRRRQEEEKSPAEKAKERLENTRRAQKRLKQFKETPQRIRKGVEKAKQVGRGVKQGAKAVGRGAKAAARTGRTAIQTAGRGARVAGQAGQVAAQAAARSAQIAAQVTARIAAQIAVRVAAQAAKIAAKLAQALVKLLANPYVLAAVIIIIVVVIIINIFLGAVNEISSLSGGSIFVPANYNNPIHRHIVDDIQQKMGGCDPKVVVYAEGVNDLKWQQDSETQAYSHKLDIRLLKTIDYLTDDVRNHRIKIDLLKTGAPDLLRESFLKRAAEYSPEGWEERELKETLSALSTGQAMAITEIDRSQVLEPTDLICGVRVPPPIRVNWQETVMEKAVRPVWEELAFSVGFLDKNIPIYEGISERNDRDAVLMLARAYKQGLGEEGAYDLFKETFRKIPRVYELIKRAMQIASSSDTFDPRTSQYLGQASGAFVLLDDEFRGIETMAEEAVADKILRLGELTDRIRSGAKAIYKATQVANMVNWDKPRRDGEKKWLLAYETRNKLRQVVKELLEMPRETFLGEEPSLFDENLVVKQIVTFSPEDDLDNGPENIDVFPWGITSVEVGGVGIATPGNDEEREPVVAFGDGKVSYADLHFSHAPVDNGVFSKHGTNYVYKLTNPDDPGWAKAGDFIFRTFPLSPGAILSSLDRLHDLFAGGCVTDINETCKRISYKDFLFVAF